MPLSNWNAVLNIDQLTYLWLYLLFVDMGLVLGTEYCVDISLVLHIYCSGESS